MGPGLGGGHGRQQGHYGLISDNIINLNVVLANGTAIRVNETSHADLFWGMRGAGHNFGIVTSFELRVYPREVDSWYYHNYIWTEDKLELLFTAANELHDNGNTPVNMVANFVTFAMNQTISETDVSSDIMFVAQIGYVSNGVHQPVIFWTFAYRGSADEAEKIIAPFNNIEAVYQDYGDVTYPRLSEVQGTAMNTETCAPNHTWITSTAGLKTYNITTTRQIYELNKQYIKQYPQLLSPAVVHEGYSTAAVHKVKSEDSAVPFRDYDFLTYVNSYST